MSTKDDTMVLTAQNVADLMQMLGVKGHISGGSWDTMSEMTKQLFIYSIVCLHFSKDKKNESDAVVDRG
jgi:hypothetical protein